MFESDDRISGIRAFGELTRRNLVNRVKTKEQGIGELELTDRLREIYSRVFYLVEVANECQENGVCDFFNERDPASKFINLKARYPWSFGFVRGPEGIGDLHIYTLSAYGKCCDHPWDNSDDDFYMTLESGYDETCTLYTFKDYLNLRVPVFIPAKYNWKNGKEKVMKFYLSEFEKFEKKFLNFVDKRMKKLSTTMK